MKCFITYSKFSTGNFRLEIFDWWIFSTGGYFRLVEIFDWQKVSTGGNFRLAKSFDWIKFSTGGNFRLAEIIYPYVYPILFYAINDT